MGLKCLCLRKSDQDVSQWYRSGKYSTPILRWYQPVQGFIKNHLNEIRFLWEWYYLWLKEKKFTAFKLDEKDYSTPIPRCCQLGQYLKKNGWINFDCKKFNLLLSVQSQTVEWIHPSSLLPGVIPVLTLRSSNNSAFMIFMAMSSYPGYSSIINCVIFALS